MAIIENEAIVAKVCNQLILQLGNDVMLAVTAKMTVMEGAQALVLGINRTEFLFRQYFFPVAVAVSRVRCRGLAQ